MSKRDTGSDLPGRDLMLADLERFGTEFRANEEVGEKRLNFFLTLSGAVAVAVTAVATSERPETTALVTPVARAATAVLLVFGVLSFLRMKRRDEVADEFKETMKVLRQRLATQSGMTDYAIPVRRSAAGRLGRGGYTETFAWLNGMVLVAHLMTYPALGLIPSVSGGLLLSLLLYLSLRK